MCPPNVGHCTHVGGNRKRGCPGGQAKGSAAEQRETIKRLLWEKWQAGDVAGMDEDDAMLARMHGAPVQPIQ